MKHLFITLFLAVLSIAGFTQENCNPYFYYYSYDFEDGTNFSPYVYNSNLNYFWDFGDGTTSTDIFPTVEYVTSGTYSVCLTVNNSEMTCEETFCLDVVICPSLSESDITVTSIDDNSILLENNNEEFDMTWNSWPGGSTLEGNSVQFDFIMSDNYYLYGYGIGSEISFDWVDMNGNMQVLNSFCSDSVTFEVDINIENPATISGTVFGDLNGNGLMDNSEGASTTLGYIIVESGQFYNYVYPNSNGVFQISVAPGDYKIASSLGFYGGLYYGLSIPTGNISTQSFGEVEGYELTVNGGDELNNLNFGVISTQSVISGTVFIDENGNGIQESTENGVPYQNIVVDGYYTGTSNSEGFYSISVVSDDHTVSINTLGDITVPLSGQYEIINPNLGQTFSDFNFGIGISGTDLETIISWVTPHVPGTYRGIWVDANNHGIAQENVVTVLELDPMVVFTNIFDGGIYDELTHTVTWIDDYSSLSAMAYYVEVFVSTEAEVGDQVFYTATINGTLEDSDLSNNVSTHQSNVVASYDPNMKQVNPAGELEEGFIEANQEMQYTLHFQNTGTYYAMNVVITDELPLELDPSTIEVMSSSHPCTSTFSEGVLRFTFSNIMLPWQEMDEKASQGFVSFRIMQDEDLPVGTTIENEVNIYFDFNDPVLTYTALNTIGDSINVVLNPNIENLNFSVSPVPAEDFMNVSWNYTSDRLAMRIFDIIGHEVLSNTAITSNNLIDVQTLSPGMYTIQLLEKNQVLGTLKFVKK